MLTCSLCTLCTLYVGSLAEKYTGRRLEVEPELMIPVCKRLRECLPSCLRHRRGRRARSCVVGDATTSPDVRCGAFCCVCVCSWAVQAWSLSGSKVKSVQALSLGEIAYDDVTVYLQGKSDDVGVDPRLSESQIPLKQFSLKADDADDT